MSLTSSIQVPKGGPEPLQIPLPGEVEELRPLEALERLAGLPNRVLLESRGRQGTFSFLSAAPRKVVSLREGDGQDPFKALERLLEPRSQVGAGTTAPGFPPFPGGIVGYLAYESGGFLERLPPPPADDVGMPGAWFGVFDWAVVWHHSFEECRLLGTPLPGSDPKELRGRMEAVAERLAGTAPDSLESRTPGKHVTAGSPLREVVRSQGTRRAEHALPAHLTSLDRDAFMAGVERIREYIRAGDLFQANLTRRITVGWEATGEELYRRMMEESPAPYGALLETGEGDVVSISPEGFLSLRGRVVETRPIKGTAPRSEDPERDRARAVALEGSEKDRAENVMIVDLLRNDLSRVCQDGSVEVPELLALESHPTVHHLVSTVRGRLRDDAGPVDLLRASFPGGSVTGAPKIRAMEILRELEPVRRGVYTGALGILGFGGDMELSIPIRTAVCRKGRVRYGTGGGITLASDPAGEWVETEDKALAFFRALGSGSAGGGS